MEGDFYGENKLTLICASLCNDYFISLSDIMLTLNKSNVLRPSIINPLQHGVDRGLMTSAAGLKLKTVVRRRHMFMWAGSMMQARSSLKYLLDNPKLSGDEIIKKIEGLSPEDINDIDLIYCYSGNPDVAIYHTKGCYAHYEDASVLVSGGSGSPHIPWREYGEPKVRKHVNVPSSVSDLIGRFGEVIHRELTSPMHYENRYGAGYELVIRNENLIFEKQSYCIDFFKKVNDISLGHISRIYFQFVGSVLFIISFTYRGGGDDLPLEYEMSSTYVCDVLTSIKGNVDFDLRKLSPRFRFSYIDKRPQGYGFYSGDNGLDFSFSKKKFEVNVIDKHISWQKRMAEG